MRGLVTEHPIEPDLVARAKNGDREALDQLLSPLRKELLDGIRVKIGPALREKLDPEDVLQEVQLRALRSVERFRWQGEGSVRAWLEGIATNLILQSAKSAGRRREHPILGEPPATDVSPSRGERREERFERLKKSVDELPPDYRTVVHLARIEGLKMREIAERMGRTESAVKNLLFKAMQKLRDSFGDTESLSLPDRELGDEGAEE